MRGLINRNEEEFNAGLITMLKNHVGRMKKRGDTLEQYFERLKLTFRSVIMAQYGMGNDETVITKYLDADLENGIKQKNLDTVLDLIDEYVDLKESVELVK